MGGDEQSELMDNFLNKTHRSLGPLLELRSAGMYISPHGYIGRMNHLDNHSVAVPDVSTFGIYKVDLKYQDCKVKRYNESGFIEMMGKLTSEDSDTVLKVQLATIKISAKEIRGWPDGEREQKILKDTCGGFRIMNLTSTCASLIPHHDVYHGGQRYEVVVSRASIETVLSEYVISKTATGMNYYGESQPEYFNRLSPNWANRLNS